MKKIFKILLVAIILFIIVWVLYKTNQTQLQQAFNNNQNNPNNQNNASAINFSSAYPIVIVHGWMGKAIDFKEYGTNLQKDGIAEYKGEMDRRSNASICPEGWPKAVSVSAEYYYDDNNEKGIESYASELNPVINLVRNCTGSDQVIILAHSMGGLVSRKYMVDYGNAQVKKLITLATPHYGFNEFTKSEIVLMILRLFTGREKDVEQMGPGSDFLIALDKADIGYRNKIVSIGTYTIDNNTLLFDLPIFPAQLKDFEKQNFLNSDLIVKLDSTKLAGSKYYQVKGCSHTQITDFRIGNSSGSINDVNACPEAYAIVKKEILASI